MVVDIAMKAAFSLDLKPNAVVSFHCCFNYHIWLEDKKFSKPIFWEIKIYQGSISP
jgi:hypothetical protein